MEKEEYIQRKRMIGGEGRDRHLGGTGKGGDRHRERERETRKKARL